MTHELLLSYREHYFSCKNRGRGFLKTNKGFIAIPFKQWKPLFLKKFTEFEQFLISTPVK